MVRRKNSRTAITNIFADTQQISVLMGYPVDGYTKHHLYSYPKALANHLIRNHSMTYPTTVNDITTATENIHSQTQKTLVVSSTSDSSIKNMKTTSDLIMQQRIKK